MKKKRKNKGYSPSVLIVDPEISRKMENLEAEITRVFQGLADALAPVNRALEDFAKAYKNGLPADLQDKINRLSFKNSRVGSKRPKK